MQRTHQGQPSDSDGYTAPYPSCSLMWKVISGLLKYMCATTHRPQAEAEYLTCRILQYQFGLVPDKGILRNSAGLRAVQGNDIVFNADGAVDA